MVRLSIKLRNPYQWLYFPSLPDGEGEALVSSTLALARWPVILWKKEWNPIVHPGWNLAMQNAVNIKEQCLITLIENLLLICHFFLVFRVTFSCHSVQKFGLALQILGRWQAASPIPNTWQSLRFLETHSELITKSSIMVYRQNLTSFAPCLAAVFAQVSRIALLCSVCCSRLRTSTARRRGASWRASFPVKSSWKYHWWGKVEVI